MVTAFLLNERLVNEFVPLVLDKQRKKFPPDLTNYRYIKDEIMMGKEVSSIILKANHLSPFIHPIIIEQISQSILYYPTERLQNYNQTEFVEYIRQRNLTGGQKKR